MKYTFQQQLKLDEALSRLKKQEPQRAQANAFSKAMDELQASSEIRSGERSRPGVTTVGGHRAEGIPKGPDADFQKYAQDLQEKARGFAMTAAKDAEENFGKMQYGAHVDVSSGVGLGGFRNPSNNRQVDSSSPQERTARALEFLKQAEAAPASTDRGPTMLGRRSKFGRPPQSLSDLKAAQLKAANEAAGITNANDLRRLIQAPPIPPPIGEEAGQAAGDMSEADQRLLAPGFGSQNGPTRPAPGSMEALGGPGTGTESDETDTGKNILTRNHLGTGLENEFNDPQTPTGGQQMPSGQFTASGFKDAQGNNWYYDAKTGKLKLRITRQ